MVQQALMEHLVCQAQCLALGTAVNKPDPVPALTELSCEGQRVNRQETDKNAAMWKIIMDKFGVGGA